MAGWHSVWSGPTCGWEDSPWNANQRRPAPRMLVNRSQGTHCLAGNRLERPDCAQLGEQPGDPPATGALAPLDNPLTSRVVRVALMNPRRTRSGDLRGPRRDGTVCAPSYQGGDARDMKERKRAPIHDDSPAGSGHTWACQGPLRTSHLACLLPRQCRQQRRRARGAQPMPRAGHREVMGCRPALGICYQHSIVCIGECMHVCCCVPHALALTWHTCSRYTNHLAPSYWHLQLPCSASS